ncbi:MAG: FAD-binding oxidoreductase [Candidatus Thorarchaeota archaeon]|nr:FAD-binding oxidoreductase [Candidatus Thorarchaeota archaeon]
MRIRDIVIGANASMYYRLNFKKIRGVYYPRTEGDILAAIEFAKEHGYDVTPKGGGSGLSGACTGGDKDRIMISSLQMREVLSVSKDMGYVDVQPGASPDDINALLEPMGMKFWVAPSSRDIASVGGILSTDGGGNDTWVNGTMRDNTIRVKLVTYDGRRLSVTYDGVRSDDPELEAELNKRGMTIHDVASSHGTLGFITEIRVAIRPLHNEDTIGAMVEYSDYDALGHAILKMIELKCPIRYGESIVMAHPDVREELRPPLLILEAPNDFDMGICDTGKVKGLDRKELAKAKDLRIKLPKRNPKTGVQFALFEGYGLYGESLKDMNRTIAAIDDLLRSHDLVPFAKYGHAPSKWYLGDNSAAYGLIMHSREIRPEGKSGPDLFQTVQDIVNLCDDIGVRAKPEHKWPFSDEAKKKRLEELRAVIGDGFNSFILDESCGTVLSSMV